MLIQDQVTVFQYSVLRNEQKKCAEQNKECCWSQGSYMTGTAAINGMEQASKTYGTGAKRGTREDSQWRAHWIEIL
jgi:hypothetical protein